MKILNYLFLLILPFNSFANTEDINQAGKSVIRIIAPIGNDAALGSGFLINTRGDIVTNYHVVENADAIAIFNGVGTANLKKATVIAQSKELDLAVINSSEITSVTALKIADDSIIVSASKIWALGYPGSSDFKKGMDAVEDKNFVVTTKTSGDISKIVEGYPWSFGGTIEAIQHTAPINHGNSGGPLLNECGSVVGVNTQFRVSENSREENYNQALFYASHASELRKFLTQNNIPFNTTSEACVAAVGDSIPLWVIITLAVFTFLALILSLRKPRQVIVQVVETASHYIRRKQQEEEITPEPKRHNNQTDTFELVGLDEYSQYRFLLVENTVTIGRSASMNTFAISDDSLSRVHIRIKTYGNGKTIEELGSTNGSAVNSKPLPKNKEVAISDGDIIQLGKVKLKYRRTRR